MQWYLMAFGRWWRWPAVPVGRRSWLRAISLAQKKVANGSSISAQCRPWRQGVAAESESRAGPLVDDQRNAVGRRANLKPGSDRWQEKTPPYWAGLRFRSAIIARVGQARRGVSRLRPSPRETPARGSRDGPRSRRRWLGPPSPYDQRPAAVHSSTAHRRRRLETGERTITIVRQLRRAGETQPGSGSGPRSWTHHRTGKLWASMTVRAAGAAW